MKNLQFCTQCIILYIYLTFRSPLERFDILSHNCLSYFSDTTSIHGPKWYNLMPNYFCRFLLAAFIIIFLVCFPVYFYKEMYVIYTSNSFSTSIEGQRDSEMKYPNLTVCYAKFFDKKRLEGKHFIFDCNIYRWFLICFNVNIGLVIPNKQAVDN